MDTQEKTYIVKIQQLLEGHVYIKAASPNQALEQADLLYNGQGEELPDMDDVCPLSFSIEETRAHPDMHYDQSEVLREILKLAKAELNEEGAIGYTMPDGKYHMYIYVDDSFGANDRHYVLEPNRVADGAHEPLGDTTTADYNDFGELMLGCIWCMEQFEMDLALMQRSAAEREQSTELSCSPYSLYQFIEEEVPFRLTQCMGYQLANISDDAHVTTEEIEQLVSIVKNHDDVMFDFDAFDNFLNSKLEEIRRDRAFPSLSERLSEANESLNAQKSGSRSKEPEQEL